MSIPVEVLEVEVLNLPPAERSRLLDRLLASLDPDLAWEDAWAQEVDRREAEIAAGRASWIPGEEVVARLRAKLKWAISSYPKQRKNLPKPSPSRQSRPVLQWRPRFWQGSSRLHIFIEANPGLGTRTSRDRGLFPLHRFPCSLVYRAENDRVSMGAVAYRSRRPGYWRTRK